MHNAWAALSNMYRCSPPNLLRISTAGPQQSNPHHLAITAVCMY